MEALFSREKYRKTFADLPGDERTRRKTIEEASEYFKLPLVWPTDYPS